MSKKLLARFGLLVIVLFGVTILTFFYTNLSPVDAAEALAVRRYNRPTPQQVELVREELGLDQPILQQYGSWLWSALHGDFGNSYTLGGRLWKNCRRHPAHPGYGCYGALLCHSAQYSTGGTVRQQKRRLGGPEHLPVRHHLYVFAELLDRLHAPARLRGLYPYFQHYGSGQPKGFRSSALALAIPMAAGNIRVFRSSLLDGYNSDFVLYARARGVSEWKIANLVSRFALPPLITMLAQSFGFMIAGSAMVESVFSIPGLGSMLVTALGARDTITINACVLLTAVIFVLVNFIADCVNAFLNPQNQKGGGL